MRSNRHRMLGKNVDLQSSIYKLKINNQFDNCSWKFEHSEGTLHDPGCPVNDKWPLPSSLSTLKAISKVDICYMLCMEQSISCGTSAFISTIILSIYTQGYATSFFSQKGTCTSNQSNPRSILIQTLYHLHADLCCPLSR